MTCQILRAGGCRVFATDISHEAVERSTVLGCADAAAQLGVDPVEEQILDFCRGHGADMILICAGTFINYRFSRRLPLLTAWLVGFVMGVALTIAVGGLAVWVG